MKRWLALALCVLSVAALNACTAKSMLEPGVTVNDIPTEAPMVFAGATVQIVGIHGPVDDDGGRGPEVKARVDKRIRERLAGGGLHLVCAPPASGPYTVLSVKVEYLPWQPLAGGDISLDGRLTDEHDRLLMSPMHHANLSFMLQDATVTAAGGIFAFTVLENLKLKYASLSEAEAALIDNCAP